ncbi:MAG: nuclear transport factor 2 family protein [Opitutales bacterium]
MNIKGIIITALALLIAGFFLSRFFSSPEGQIRQQISKLEELVSYEPGEGDLGTLTKIKRLESLFVEEAEIRLKGYGQQHSLEGRKQVQQAAMLTRTRAKSLEASLHDLHIEVSEDEQSATVEATGRAKFDGENQSVVQEFLFRFEKTPDGWLIATVETVQALR